MGLCVLLPTTRKAQAPALQAFQVSSPQCHDCGHDLNFCPSEFEEL